MKSFRSLPGVSLAAGLAGAAAYALFLSRGYDHTVDLPVAGQPWLAVLAVLTLALAALALLCSFRLPKEDFDRQTAFERWLGGDSPLVRTGGVLAGFLMAAGGALGLFGVYQNMQAEALQTGMAARPDVLTLVLYALAILTGIVLILALPLFRTVTESAAALTIVPIFWSCFDMILTFKENGDNPMMSLYLWELLAAGAVTLAFYEISAVLFDKPRPRRMSAVLACAAGLCLTGGLGKLAAMALSPDLRALDDAGRHLCLLAGAVWSLAVLARMSRTDFSQFPREKTEN